MTHLSASALLPLWVGLGGTFLGGVALALPRVRRSLLPAAMLLAGPPLLAVTWWYARTASTDVSASQTNAVPYADYRIEMRRVADVTAVTDQGRFIPLGTPASPVSDENLTAVEDVRFRTHNLERKVIHLSDPDPTCNCHGWVFSGGRYWVPGDRIDDILTDNEYTRTSEPAVGDLAVYRDERGDVVHTGVVCSVAVHTLVESKWGPMGRYIHSPDDQPFGGTCTFYHTDRGGHLLNGLPHEDEQSDGFDQTEPIR